MSEERPKYGNLPLPVVEEIYITVAVKNQRGDMDKESIINAMKEYQQFENRELIEALKKVRSYMHHDEGKEPGGLRMIDVMYLVEQAILEATE